MANSGGKMSSDVRNVGEGGTDLINAERVP